MARKQFLYVDAGSTFNTTVVAKHANGDIMDLTGHTASGKLRKHFGSSNSVSFVAEIGDGDGEVVLSLTADVTANIEGGVYVYDVEVVSGNTITRILEGFVTVGPEATR